MIRSRSSLVRLAFLLVPVCAVLPHAAHAAVATTTLAAHSTGVEPYTAVLSVSFPLNNTFNLVATGTLTYITLPIAGANGLQGTDTILYRLFNQALARVLDCQTPTKTVDEWGITHLAQDPHAPMVTVGPFTGSECLLLDSAKQGTVSLIAYRNGSAPGAPGFMGNSSPQRYTFTATGLHDFGNTSLGVDNVLFLPGLEGSRLKEGNNQLWPPTPITDASHDLQSLQLMSDGTSQHNVVVDGVLNTFYGHSVYQDFSQFMDALATVDPATGTSSIKEWKPLAYDWRFAPDTIIADGIETTTGHIDPVAEVERLAHDSPTGKITIIAHSYGGLVGKALIKALVQKGEGNLVSTFVLVGSPQLGTPSSLAGLLHGDGQAIPGGIALPGFIVSAPEARTLGQNMPSAYMLIPSPAYFTEVLDPTITFDTHSNFTASWIAYWGTFINTYPALKEFLTGQGVSRTTPDESDLDTPAILSQPLLALAEQTHEIYDTFAFPPTMRVVQVAGWGLPTTKAITYTNQHFLGFPTAIPGYDIGLTLEGDKTVVYPSALSSNGEEYFFNLFEYNKNEHKKAEHAVLLNTLPIETFVKKILFKSDLSNIGYLSSTRPDVSSTDDQLLIQTSSPVNIGAYDTLGNFTGVDPNQATSSAFLTVSENIPGSTFIASSAHQNIFLPYSGVYQVEYYGIDSGPTTITVSTVSGGTTILVTTFSDMPTTPETKAVFSFDSAVPTESTIVLDLNADGIPDFYATSDDTTPTLDELLVNLRTTANSLNVPDGIKNKFLNRIGLLEKKAKKLQDKHPDKLDKLIHQLNSLDRIITRQEKKGLLMDQDIQTLLDLLNEIETLI